MEWLKHLSDAIAYIEEHLTDEISIEEAAGIAGCSVYYFQRLFTFAAGISLGEYIRRRRMSQAALQLQTAGAGRGFNLRLLLPHLLQPGVSGGSRHSAGSGQK